MKILLFNNCVAERDMFLKILLAKILLAKKFTKLVRETESSNAINFFMKQSQNALQKINKFLWLIDILRIKKSWLQNIN